MSGFIRVRDAHCIPCDRVTRQLQHQESKDAPWGPWGCIECVKASLEGVRPDITTENVRRALSMMPDVARQALWRLSTDEDYLLPGAGLAMFMRLGLLQGFDASEFGHACASELMCPERPPRHAKPFGSRKFRWP